MTSDEQAIRNVIETWMRATREGDTQTVLDLMTDDAVFLVPGQKPFGKEAFAAAAGHMKDLRIDSTSRIEELQLLGDWAWTRSYIDVKVRQRGEVAHRAGYALTIFRKETDGQWRLARDANLLTAI